MQYGRICCFGGIPQGSIDEFYIVQVRSTPEIDQKVFTRKDPAVPANQIVTCFWAGFVGRSFMNFDRGRAVGLSIRNASSSAGRCLVFNKSSAL